MTDEKTRREQIAVCTQQYPDRPYLGLPILGGDVHRIAYSLVLYYICCWQHPIDLVLPRMCRYVWGRSRSLVPEVAQFDRYVVEAEFCQLSEQLAV